MKLTNIFGGPIKPISRPGQCQMMVGGLWGTICGKQANRVVQGELGELRRCCDDCMPEAIRLEYIEVTEEELSIIDVLNA